jgi:tRNA modification GTPase
MGDRDTIVAISSGQGAAGVAVIRISGDLAPEILRRLGALRQEPRKAELVRLKHPATGEVLDHALALAFPAPHSFTGEHVGEFHVHGGRAVQAAVIDAVLSVSPSIRVAMAGEFTRRAFHNGKLDLSEIEGLAALIDSETEWQRRQAIRLLDGELGRMATSWRKSLIEAMASIDARLDFSDEGDVAEDGLKQELDLLLGPVVKGIKGILGSAGHGERLREGYRVAIVGEPNAGKSSLLNAIARRDVAIVSSQPGTTRDVLELRCDIGGLPVTFYDTAGLRASDDVVEQEGIRRAVNVAVEADIVLHLHPVDSSMKRSRQFDGIVWNISSKADLAKPEEQEIAVSAMTGAGLDHLLQALERHFKDSHGGEPALVSDARQRGAMLAAVFYIESAMERIGVIEAAMPEELLAESLRLAVRSLDALIGRVAVDDVLDQIFARFCIGK